MENHSYNETVISKDTTSTSSLKDTVFDTQAMIQTARRVLNTEAEAMQKMAERVDESFVKACQCILSCKGLVIVTGMGKSGHIAQKIAASLTSTGIACHFLHPAEGFHGDLGVIHREDLIMALSFSGETEEIIDLLASVRHLDVPVIAITSRSDSSLARMANVVLTLGEAREADPYNLIPTTSTTLSLALGDALTVALMELRKFTPEDFAIFHPRGMLGKRLKLQVQNLLKGDKTNPVIVESSMFSMALEVITRYTLGGTSIVNQEGKLSGIITDGDVRRIMERFSRQGGTVAEVMSTPASQLMTKNPTFVYAKTLAYDALKVMENHKPRPIFILPVVDDSSRPVGMLHLHALVQAGFKTPYA